MVESSESITQGKKEVRDVWWYPAPRRTVRVEDLLVMDLNPTSWRPGEIARPQKMTYVDADLVRMHLRFHDGVEYDADYHPIERPFSLLGVYYRFVMAKDPGGETMIQQGHNPSSLLQDYREMRKRYHFYWLDDERLNQLHMKLCGEEPFPLFVRTAGLNGISHNGHI